MQYIVSITPIVTLFVLILVFKLSGHLSALLTLIVAVLLSLTVIPKLGITPAEYDNVDMSGLVGWSMVEGVLKALFPIFLIIWMAIFSYIILVESKQIEIIKQQFISLTEDKGILVLLMVWGFGGLLEGMAGFGTAVAIPAAILIGLGFKPFFSALVALLGNTVATGFAALGVPVRTLCNEATIGGEATTQMICEVSTFTILQLSPLFFIIPFIILMLTDKSEWKKNFILTIWVGGISFLVQFFCAYYIGAETPAIIGSISAIFALITAAKLKPRLKQEHAEKIKNLSLAQFLRAWSGYLIILILILISGNMCPEINHFLKSHLVSSVHIPVINTVFRLDGFPTQPFSY